MKYIPKIKKYVDPRYFLNENNEFFENTEIIDFFKNLILNLNYPFKFIETYDNFRDEGLIFLDFSWDLELKDLPYGNQKEELKEDIAASLEMNGIKIKEKTYFVNIMNFLMNV